MNGTLYSTQADGTSFKLVADNATGNILVTTDGFAYAFFFNGTPNANGASMTTLCGSAEALTKATTTQDFNGTNAKCLVAVDINGPAKGQKGFNTAIQPNTAITDAMLASDKFLFSMSGGGVRPLYVANSTYVNKGWEYIYGTSGGNPINDPVDEGEEEGGGEEEGEVAGES